MITGIGVHDRTDWPFTITGMRSRGRRPQCAGGINVVEAIEDAPIGHLRPDRGSVTRRRSACNDDFPGFHHSTNSEPASRAFCGRPRRRACLTVAVSSADRVAGTIVQGVADGFSALVLLCAAV